jgi:hypothetical protein
VLRQIRGFAKKPLYSSFSIMRMLQPSALVTVGALSLQIGDRLLATQSNGVQSC